MRWLVPPASPVPHRAPDAVLGVVRRLTPVVALAFVLAGAVLASLALPAPHEAVAQGAPWQCQASIDGVPLDTFGDYDNALPIRADDSLAVAFEIQGVGRTSKVPGTVTVSVGPISTDVVSFEARDGRWVAEPPIRVGDHLQVIGLYRVVVSAGDCEPISGWVKVGGAHPLTTPVGAIAALVGVAGIAGMLFIALRVLNAGRGLVFGIMMAVLCGLMVGLSGCVLAQQFGWEPLTWNSWARWSTPPVGIGAVVNAGAGLLGRRRTAGHGSAPGLEDIRDEASPNGGGANAPEAPAPTALPPSSTPPSAPVPAPQPAPVSTPAPAPTTTTPGVPTSVGTVTPNGATPSLAPMPGASAGMGESREATYSAHGLLDCPPVVVVGREFTLEVGLSPEQVTGVTGEAFELPSPAVESYELLVELDTPGFVVSDGAALRRSLTISEGQRFPTVDVRLVPLALRGEGPDVRSIRALFVLEGAVIGYAKRYVTTVATEADLDAADEPAQGERGMVAIPQQRTVADLTVVIEEDEESRGRLRWTMTSPHVALPPGALEVTDIGDAPGQFARQLVDGVGSREGTPGLASYLLGVGHTVAEQLPPQFWSMLDSVAAHARAEGRAPTIFLLSEEPYVPWELATVEPRLDPQAPPFLGAQTCVGRWVLGTRRPKLPPPAEVVISSIAVISGQYALPGWSPLLEAEAEAEALQERYGAVAVNALATDVLSCLGGEPAAELLHFAMHGIYDPNSTLHGLVLADGQTIDPLQIRGHTFTRAPFVFLNACQVGSAQRILGDYAGMAEAFLFSGAAGVLAPLWSIKDTVAHEIALRFYEQSFAGVPPAEILRRERGAFGDGVDVVSATSLAYLFYGHPSLRLKRNGGIDDA